MKKALVLALSVIGFILIAAPTAVEYHPVFLNGKPIGNAIIGEDGIIALSLADLVKAGGGTLTLEPYFQLQGNRLLAVKGEEQLKIKLGTTQGSLVPAVQTPYKESPAYKESPHGALDTQAGMKLTPGQIFRVQRAGEISSHVFMKGGKAFVPVSDVARAFGGVFINPATISGNTPAGAAAVNGGTLKPGEAIRLNFAKNPHAILIGL
jgi:hypothetical protein